MRAIKGEGKESQLLSGNVVFSTDAFGESSCTILVGPR